jgi:acyl dehydratase
MSVIVQWLLTGKIKQHIYKIYSLENAAESLQDLIDQKVIGKAIIKVGNWQQDLKVSASTLPDNQPIKNLGNLETPTVFKDKTELKKNIGRSLGKTEWLQITQERINQFAEATLDYQWVHVDAQKAKSLLPGGKTIAHGYLTMSLASQFFYQLISIEKINTFINYGVNKARFISPVQVGSEIRMTAHIQ